MGIRTAIVGVTGYTGRELLRWLLHHPHFHLTHLIARSQEGKDRSLPPLIATSTSLMERIQNLPPEALAGEVDLVFLALPQGQSAEWVASLLPSGCVVVDLSAQFRLRNLELYSQAYGAHPAPELLPRAVYGLCEWYREEIRGSNLIANPGCYPTAFLLAILPFAEYLAEGTPIIVDALSGVTGAGRSAKTELLFGELLENARPYGLPHHRHTGEMTEQLSSYTRTPPHILFTPHLIPQSRGIVMTITAQLTLDPSSARRVLTERYRGEPFVHILPEGVIPESAWVRGSNHVMINLFPREGGWYTLISVIDNLGKGAASQAIQNANIRFGLPEETGLELPPWFP